MRRLTVGLVLVLVLSASVVQADPFVATVPGQNWQIILNTPPIEEYQGQSKGKSFLFVGKNARAGLLFSFAGESWDKGGNAECRASVWSKLSQTPRLEKDSVKMADAEKYVQVIYRTEAEIQGKKVKQANADFFFVFKGSCVDVHLSRTPYAEGDEKLLHAIGSTLNWVSSEK